MNAAIETEEKKEAVLSGCQFDPAKELRMRPAMLRQEQRICFVDHCCPEFYEDGLPCFQEMSKCPHFKNALEYEDFRDEVFGQLEVEKEELRQQLGRIVAIVKGHDAPFDFDDKLPEVFFGELEKLLKDSEEQKRKLCQEVMKLKSELMKYKRV